MKINHKIFGLVGAIGLLLAGCSTEEDLTTTFHDDVNAVRITAEVGKTSVDGFTRSNPLGTTEQEQMKFNDGDEISVKAEGQDAVTYKLTSNVWKPQGDKYLKWQSNEMIFTAYYPATFDGTLTQPTEYTTLESLAAADFMSYTGTQSKPDNNTLALSMERKMARVVIDIAGFNNQYAANTVVNSVTINGKVKAFKHNDNKFYALMVPCEAQTDQQFLSLEVGESNTVETVKGIPTLEAGKSYTYHLTVGKDKVEVNGITVEDWTTGTTIDGGEPTWIPYVSFTAAATQTFKMTTTGNYTISNLEYSLDGNEWTAVEADKEVEFGGAKGSLFLRGKNPNGTASSSLYNYSTITFTNSNVKVACTGDIRTLLDWEDYENVETKDARFYNLFRNCTALTSAPKLPATTLASYCYYYMFSGCESLQTAPELPATILKYECYRGMFSRCASLKTAPALPATTLEFDCYSDMFSECASLESAPALPATKMASQCYSGMFDGCSSLKVAPSLPATTLARNCYSGMFWNCKNLTTAPELKATALVDLCYDQMFGNCNKLTNITILAPSSEISEKYKCVSNWLTYAGTDASVTSRTLKVKDKAAYDALVNQGLPENWKIGKCIVLDENGNEIIIDE